MLEGLGGDRRTRAGTGQHARRADPLDRGGRLVTPRLEAAIHDATATLPGELWVALDEVIPHGIALDA
jgi:hypothetical protein